METATIVQFRREKDALECQAEYDAATARGEDIDHTEVDRWVYMGERVMGSLPVKEAFMFVNGVSYVVLDVTVSLTINELPGQPCFDDPYAMVTLRPGRGWSDGVSPLHDFIR